MNSEQRGVAIGMASALLVAVTLLVLAAIYGDGLFVSSPSLEFRLELLAISVLLPTMTLLFCIARLAKHRFFTPEDINGSALTEGTKRAKLLQSLLQNTLEQLTLAFSVYFVCALLFPDILLVIILTASVMFFVGRILFYAGYAGGAPSRAFGFAFTFYPTILLAFLASYFLVVRFAV